MSKRFVKRPIAVEAFRFGYDDMPDWFTPAMIRMNYENAIPYLEGCISTLEGDMWFSEGDYVIRGVNGEQYPCKGDIFEKTYEEENTRQLKGEKDALSLGECMKKYPLGSYLVNVESFSLEECVPHMDKEQCLHASKFEKALYSPQKDDAGGFRFAFIYEEALTKKYKIAYLWGDQISTYRTDDGSAFYPLSYEPDNRSYLGEELLCYTIIEETLLPDFSNIDDILVKVSEAINKKCAANYLFFYTYQDFLKEGEQE